MTEHEASPSRCSEFPPWVLLDTIVQVRRCENKTTAHGTNSAGRPINMSFEVVDPPGLSHCVIDCPDLTEGELTAYVSGADGAFLLMRVLFPERGGRQAFEDVFVYKAGPGTPSLCRLPQPYPVRLGSKYVGVLSCGVAGEHCLVVVPERQLGANNRVRYDLQVFSTKTKSWSPKDPGCRVARICVTSLLPPKCSPSQETRWPGLISSSVFCCEKRLTRTLRCC
ncbi:hypothetical protein PVAP13_2KG181100 [Panicum virgatum]|uniref:Uncharacterized protein n=1 Tax=Panicum virgatum TaxID=38727 RepID=A0A8T0WA87_PANVG|nr:hypothetical protein PVAP13_2KG181100 [Panicum virgatum]